MLESDNRAGRVVELAERVRSIALRVIASSPDAGRHACKAGCAFCCHTGVTVSVPEAIAIVRYLSRRLDDTEREAVLARIEVNVRLAATLSHADYTARSVRCALLTDDGTCRAHAVRPLACAGFLSTSREACEAEFNRVPDRQAVPVDRFAQQAALGASYGLKQACSAARLDGRYYELHHALRALWTLSDAPRRWAAGDPLLTGCLTADAWDRG